MSKRELLLKQSEISEVVFDENKHLYNYRGRQLYGVTSAIAGGESRQPFYSPLLEVCAAYGTLVHSEVERLYNSNTIPTQPTVATGAALEIINAIKYEEEMDDVYCEVMVSDFTATASKVDVVLVNHRLKQVILADIKTGNYNKKKCNIQLHTYKQLFVLNYDYTVRDMYVILTKEKQLKRVDDKYSDEVENILKYNKKKLKIS